jgi:GT2 family glycosyltransferase
LNETPYENTERVSRDDREADLLSELAQKQRKILVLEADLAQRETEIRRLEAALAGVYASTTWKLGTPLRLAKRMLASLTRPTPHGEPRTVETGAAPRPGEEGVPANYAQWQRGRLAERMRAAKTSTELWNHLITIVIFARGADVRDLASTLESLHRQTYRNVEVLVAGASEPPPGLGDFTGHRGLFVEPALDPLDLLNSPAADRLWRGSYLTFARAGTGFDSDAFAVINAALNPVPGKPAPDLIVCDHDRRDDAGDLREPSFVPGWDPDFICEFDYVETAFVASRALVMARRAEPHASLHDWLWRIARCAVQPVTRHVAEPLVHMPANAPRPALRPAMPAVHAGSGAELPAVAIVIPNRNKPDLLERCVSFLNFENRFRPELVVVDNASDEAAVRAMYRDLIARHGARIVQMDRSFNFSCIINAGVAATSAEVVLLLNNDVEITAPGLLEQMAAYAMRPEVGVVGSRLMYPDGTVQHTGMLLRPGTSRDHCVRAEHVLRRAPGSADGYLYQLRTIRNYQCVTGALLAMRREVFDRLGGFDEVDLPVEFGDVDFCLRARAAGWRVIALPLDGIVHRESSTRGTASPPAVIAMRSAAMQVIAERWADAVAHDPFRNPWVELGEMPEARFPWSADASS